MKTYGQSAYEAYRAHTGGVSLATGAPIPEWEALSPEIQAAWEAAGSAAANEAAHRILGADLYASGVADGQ